MNPYICWFHCTSSNSTVTRPILELGRSSISVSLSNGILRVIDPSDPARLILNHWYHFIQHRSRTMIDWSRPISTVDTRTQESTHPLVRAPHHPYRTDRPALVRWSLLVQWLFSQWTIVSLKGFEIGERLFLSIFDTLHHKYHHYSKWYWALMISEFMTSCNIIKNEY